MEPEQKPQDAIYIVDETSMLDVFIGRRFMKVINDRTNVLFIGDPFQLPSVSPGSILRDVIFSLYI